MSATPTCPTILLLQGAFQLPEVYEKLTVALKAQGFPVVHPSLPSLCGQDEPDFGSKSLTADADVAQAALRRLVEDENRFVLVLMHSYGGLVGTEAVPEDLGQKSRRSRGLQGGVIHLFFFTAFILAEGQSVAGSFGESPNNGIRAGGRSYMKNPARTMYSDLPEDEAEHWAAKTIDQSLGVQGTPLTRAAYRYVPSTYVVCENDQAVPPQVQEMFGNNAGAALLRLDSGHSPMLSKTDELAGMITDVAHQAVGQSL
ncbi:alpha/beta-hydrolase [Apiospora rasikravindrae]|uniref:Alpha/beta-hydrolase n=1 Tax=Apiospora rasikravindrae TaxID=990691 RepID=A0ABR1T5A5_9PEZI